MSSYTPKILSDQKTAFFGHFLFLVLEMFTVGLSQVSLYICKQDNALRIML